jgi:fructose-specific component phosphotransferase system IIB-like protein
VARHVRFFVFGALALAVPATAHTLGFPRAAAPQTCLAFGKTTWRVATGSGSADVTVRIDPTATVRGIRIQLVDTPDAADFVFVDDGAPARCEGARSVVIDAAATAPDLTINFASGAQAADYRIYARSGRLGPEAVAALFAAAQAPKRKLTARNEQVEWDRSR